MWKRKLSMLLISTIFRLTLAHPGLSSRRLCELLLFNQHHVVLNDVLQVRFHVGEVFRFSGDLQYTKSKSRSLGVATAAGACRVDIHAL